MTKKECLLYSAKKLFASQGYDKTSIREIANDANANSSMISYYFGGKEGIIEGIFEYFFPSEAITHRYSNPLDELSNLLKQIIQLRVEDTELIDILHSEIILKSPRLPLIQPYIGSSWSRIYELLEICISNGDIHVDAIDSAYLYLLAGISFPYHNPIFFTDNSNESFDTDFVSQIVHMLMKGLK